jgi:hypothetical protein
MEIINEARSKQQIANRSYVFRTNTWSGILGIVSMLSLTFILFFWTILLCQVVFGNARISFSCSVLMGSMCMPASFMLILLIDSRCVFLFRFVLHSLFNGVAFWIASVIYRVNTGVLIEEFRILDAWVTAL